MVSGEQKHSYILVSLVFAGGSGAGQRTRRDTERNDIFIQIDSQNLVDKPREHRLKHLEIYHIFLSYILR